MVSPHHIHHASRGPVPVRTHLRLALGLALLSIATGTVGYRLIEGWTWLESIWMVMITVTTIGYGEIHELSPEGRVFTLIFIMGGLSIGTYTAAQLTRYFLEGDMLRDLRTDWRVRRMSRLDKHFIVAGFGRLGHEVTEGLLHAGRSVVVIDHDPAALGDARELGATWLEGDASDDNVLKEAGVERAAGLAVATSSDALNVLVTLSARQLNPQLVIYTRVDNSQTASKARHAGANHVINPYERGGAAMTIGMLRPHTRDFMELAVSRTYADLSIDDVQLSQDSGCTGKLGDLDISGRFRVIVVALRSGGGPLTTAPAADTVLHAGDVLVVVGRPEDIAAFSARVASS